MEELNRKIEKRIDEGNHRELKIEEGFYDFSSNDYIGLSRSKNLLNLFFEEFNKISKKHNNGLGSTGSRLLSGNSEYALKLEKEIAAFHGYEAARLFNCGYMANLGLLSCIAQDDDVVYYDNYVHPSTKNGIRLSRCNAYPFRHNDLNHLESRLKKSTLYKNVYICVESIYSTLGSILPLKELYLLSEKYGAKLIVDEAHAIGVIGSKGRGLIAKENLEGKIFAHINTFGKALGVQGAVVLGSEKLIEYLTNFSSSFIYTTALPNINLAAIKASYALFPKMEKERQHLKKLIAISNENSLCKSMSHIQTFSIQGNHNLKKTIYALNKKGFSVSGLLSPTVRKGAETMRISLHSYNSEIEVINLMNYLKDLR